MAEGFRAVTVRVERITYDRIREYAAAERRSLSQIAERWLEVGLAAELAAKARETA